MSETKNEVRSQVGQLIAVGAERAASLFDISESTWRRWASAGLVPSPVRVGGSGPPRWIVADLQRWALAGCPARYQFESGTTLATVRGDGRIGVLENRESF